MQISRLYRFLCFCIVLTLLPITTLEAQTKLKGKALKAKMEQIQFFEGDPERSYKKIAPIWASNSSMSSTLKSIRKQAAKLGADAVIQIEIQTKPVVRTYSYPTFWGGWGFGWGDYWGNDFSVDTYLQPVVKGWAVQWID